MILPETEIIIGKDSPKQDRELNNRKTYGKTVNVFYEVIKEFEFHGHF
jgi:hypothetical protein